MGHAVILLVKEIVEVERVDGKEVALTEIVLKNAMDHVKADVALLLVFNI